MIFQPPFVATQLLLHFLAALVERGVDFVVCRLSRRGQAGRQVNGCFTDMFVATARKHDLRVGRTFSVFFYDSAERILHMGLQGVADIDLFSADLVAHGTSINANGRHREMSRNGRQSVL